MATLKLFPGEKLIYKTKPHLIFLLGPIVALLLLWLVLWLGSCPVLDIFSLQSVCHIIASAIILLSITVIFLDWHFYSLYLTNFRVFKERGIVGKRYTSIWLVKIQDVIAQFGFWGRVLGFGDVVIESAGALGIMRFEGFPSPIRIKELIETETLKISYS